MHQTLYSKDLISSGLFDSHIKEMRGQSAIFCHLSLMYEGVSKSNGFVCTTVIY